MPTIIDGTAGITFPNSTIQASAGSVLQVVQGSLTGQVSTTSTSYVTTGLSATITPKFSTSKVLIQVTLPTCYISTANVYGYYTIYRGGTNLASGSGATANLGGIRSDGAALTTNVCFSFVDSPATTSATTYTVYFNQQTAGTVYINTFGGPTSYVVLSEIAG
jgi:hypothetical protein